MRGGVRWMSSFATSVGVSAEDRAEVSAWIDAACRVDSSASTAAVSARWRPRRITRLTQTTMSATTSDVTQRTESEPSTGIPASDITSGLSDQQSTTVTSPGPKPPYQTATATAPTYRAYWGPSAGVRNARPIVTVTTASTAATPYRAVAVRAVSPCRAEPVLGSGVTRHMM